tara:strand:- start:4437 stop:4916 length:480 start_codon:yes stop_codon:yes gene_type:complete
MNAYTPLRPAGTTVRWLDSVYTIQLGPAETGGAVGMFAAIVQPDAGPPRHIHRNEDEIIHVIEGEVTFWLEGQILARRGGDTVFIPRGKEHAFHVTGAEPARFVTVVTPGGFESFFARAAEAGLQPQRHRAELDALAAAYGCVFTGPPLRVGTPAAAGA